MKVAWVHPSWRDLVIAQLAGDGVQRRHFLGRCGVHGLILALSTSGGAAGERRLPLILVDEDWDVVGDRIFELVSELEPGEMVALLAALGEAVDELSRAPAGREAAALAAATLDRVVQRWRPRRDPIPLPELEAWLALGKRLDPPPVLPELGATWAELLPTSVPDPGDRVEVERLADWFALCDLAWSYDRRLAPESPAPQIRMAQAFMDAVRSDPSHSQGEHVRRALSSIRSLLPALEPRARMLANALRVEDPFEPLRDIRVESAEGNPGDLGLFDVGRVLEDL